LVGLHECFLQTHLVTPVLSILWLVDKVSNCDQFDLSSQYIVYFQNVRWQWRLRSKTQTREKVLFSLPTDQRDLNQHCGDRVARWYIFKLKIQIWEFWGHLVNFSHLVYFMAIWYICWLSLYIFPRCSSKNLVTVSLSLEESRGTVIIYWVVYLQRHFLLSYANELAYVGRSLQVPEKSFVLRSGLWTTGDSVKTLETFSPKQKWRFYSRQVFAKNTIITLLFNRIAIFVKNWSNVEIIDPSNLSGL
jgi:hypothetical protein